MCAKTVLECSWTFDINKAQPCPDIASESSTRHYDVHFLSCLTLTGVGRHTRSTRQMETQPDAVANRDGVPEPLSCHLEQSKWKRGPKPMVRVAFSSL